MPVKTALNVFSLKERDIKKSMLLILMVALNNFTKMNSKCLNFFQFEFDIALIKKLPSHEFKSVGKHCIIYAVIEV